MTGGTGDGRAATIAVLGPGGVGGLLGALAARAGHRVICVAGEETARVLRTEGIRVRSARFGDFTARVEADTALREPVDACLVTVKHTALEASLERVPPTVLGDGLAVPFLNGVEHPEMLRRRYPRVVSGVIRVESTRVAPGIVEHTSPFADVELAGDGGTLKRERLDALATTFAGTGVDVRVGDDETATLWSKLTFLAPIALLTTRYGTPIGDVRALYGAELAAMVEEIAAVSTATGAPSDPAVTFGRLNSLPPTMRSSMQRDAEAGRTLELDAIGGALLRAAERAGVPVPVTARVVGELKARA